VQRIGNVFLSVGIAIATRRLLRTFSSLGFDTVLEPLGLTRRRRHWPENLAFIGAGIVVGGVTALLLAPGSGRETRAHVAKTAGKLGEAAAEQVREAGRELRDEARAVRPPGNGGSSSTRDS
jgi:hypothetical protein